MVYFEGGTKEQFSGDRQFNYGNMHGVKSGTMKQWQLEKRWRIILSGTLIVTAPILGLALFVYVEISGHLKDIINQENRQAVNNIATHIEEALNDNIRNSGLFVTRLLLKEAVRQRDRKSITRHLKNYVDLVSSVERAFVADRQGTLLADYPEDRAVIGKSFSYRDWYKGVSKNWEPYVSEFYLRAGRPQKYLFAVAVPIRDSDNNVIGVLVLQASENYIQDAISHIPALKNQKVYIVDRKGNLIYHPDYRVDRIIDFTGFPPGRNVINGQSGVEMMKNPDGAAMLTAFQPVKKWGWGVIVQRPAQEVYTSLRELTYGLFAFTSIMIATGALLAYRRSETLFSIKKLSGELETRVEERTAGLANAMELLRSEMDSRRQATAAMQESEGKYRRLVENSLVGIYKTTMSGDFIYVNNALANIAGFNSPEEIMAEGLSKRYWNPGDQERLIEMLRKRGKAEQIELEFLTRTGKTKEVVTSAVLEGDTISGMLIDVTDRKHAEEALRYHERLLREMGRVAKIGGWEFDPATGKGTWTAEVARIHDLDPDDETNVERGMSFYHGESRSKIEKAIREAIELGQPFDLELEMVTAKGANKWVQSIGHPILENGKVVHVRGSFQDITARKQAEKNLEMSERRISDTLDNLPGMAYRCRNDRNWTMQYISKGCRKVTGYLSEDLIDNKRLSFNDLILPEYQEPIREKWQKVLDAGLFFEDEYPIYAATGEIKWVWERGRGVVDDKGVVLYLDGYIEDITERKQAEKALQENAASLKRAQEIAKMGSWSNDLTSGRTSWSDEMYRVLGVSSETFTPDTESFINLIHPEDRSAMQEWISACIAGKKPSELDFRVVASDGTVRFIRGRGELIYDAAGKAASLAGTAQDITEQRKLEAQLIHSQKMESIGTFAGGIAHDFNNILSAIVGYGHVALMKMAAEDPQRPTIEHILEAADRAAYLTKQILMFSRKQKSERTSVDLNEVVRKVEKFLKRVIGEDVECKTIMQDRLIPILADSYQLEQVLMNLATNARDSMPKGGSFTIETQEFTMEEDFISAHGYGKAGLYALITISDTGAGMDEETRKHIFEPFFTTKEVGKGTGLGLAVAYGIVKDHEGFINVYSEPGKGTTFRIHLPIIPSAAREETAARREGAPSRGSETVLLAEDDEALRKLMRTVLTEYGYTVIEAVDGEDAVRKFTENQKAVRILLFDLIMPKMNGKEAYDEIRKIRPDMKVIFASGYAADMVRQEASLDDGAYLILKPVSPFELLKKVRSVLDETIMTDKGRLS